jgi:hypothetical protein
MDKTIPTNVAEVDGGDGLTDDAPSRNELEFELLEVERALSRLLHREINQRYIIKWIAIISGVVVILGMAAALAHLVHMAFLGPFLFASAAFSVAMIVAPVISITTITVAMFVGAFRRFEDKDLEAMGNGAVGAAGFIKGG